MTRNECHASVFRFYWRRNTSICLVCHHMRNANHFDFLLLFAKMITVWIERANITCSIWWAYRMQCSAHHIPCDGWAAVILFFLTAVGIRMRIILYLEGGRKTVDNLVEFNWTFWENSNFVAQGLNIHFFIVIDTKYFVQ